MTDAEKLALMGPLVRAQHDALGPNDAQLAAVMLATGLPEDAACELMSGGGQMDGEGPADQPPVAY